MLRRGITFCSLTTHTLRGAGAANGTASVSWRGPAGAADVFSTPSHTDIVNGNLQSLDLAPPAGNSLLCARPLTHANQTRVFI